MDDLDRLAREHAELRGRVNALVRQVGPQNGVGWDDVGDCALDEIRRAQAAFAKMLASHERFEERCIARACADAPELAGWIDKNHQDLDALLMLLRAVSEICDGAHVHSLRTVTERLCEEVETHLRFEERILFPVLRARAKEAV